MSVNKILALIGSILATIFSLFYFSIAFYTGISILSESYYDPDMFIFGIIIVLLTLIVLVALVMNWVAFTQLDKANEKPWKIYFLVMGILSCLSAFGIITAGEIIPGVLFILVFALNSNKSSEKNLSVTQESPVTVSLSSSLPQTLPAESENVTPPLTMTEVEADLPLDEESTSASSALDSTDTSDYDEKENDEIFQLPDQLVNSESAAEEMSFNWIETSSSSEEGEKNES
ncbi:MAG: hypothetical protein LBV19_04560 [Streptococcaceae bacterium]|jgi:hypothetical protein|nr:hypothetical protein [Streptococcaceae bacterium]